MIQGFHTPSTIEEALELARRFGDRGLFLGGGVEVNSTESRREPEHLISLAGLGLDRVEVAADEVVVGACCSYQRLLDECGVPVALKTAAAEIANRNIRNQATLGGAIAGDQPVGDLLPALVALEACLDVHGDDGLVQVPVDDWLADRAGLVAAIRVPLPARPVAFRTHARSTSDRSFLVVAVSLDVADGRVARPIVAVAGVTGRTARLGALEDWLDGAPLPDQQAIEAKVADLVDPPADFRAGSAVKRAVVGVLIARAVHAAFGGKGAVR